MSTKAKSIKVDMRKSAPGIVNNCVMIGSGFFALNKISYIDEIYEYYDNGAGHIKSYEFICDSILFQVRWNYLGSFETEKDVNTHDVEKFNKFHNDLIDLVFDKDTKRNHDRSYI